MQFFQYLLPALSDWFYYCNFLGLQGLSILQDVCRWWEFWIRLIWMRVGRRANFWDLLTWYLRFILVFVFVSIFLGFLLKRWLLNIGHYVFGLSIIGSKLIIFVVFVNQMAIHLIKIDFQGHTKMPEMMIALTQSTYESLILTVFVNTQHWEWLLLMLLYVTGRVVEVWEVSRQAWALFLVVVFRKFE